MGKMGRKKLPEDKRLKHLLSTRVNEEKFQQLSEILLYAPRMGMSDLIRNILENKRIKTFYHDPSIDPVIEEIRLICEKIRQTGILINKYTKSFNSHQDLPPKLFYAKLVFINAVSLEKEYTRLLEIVSELAKRWLTEGSEKKKRNSSITLSPHSDLKSIRDALCPVLKTQTTE